MAVSIPVLLSIPDARLESNHLTRTSRTSASHSPSSLVNQVSCQTIWRPRRDSNPDSETENLTNWPVIRQGLKLFTEFQRPSVYCLTGCSRCSMRLRLFARTNWWRRQRVELAKTKGQRVYSPHRFPIRYIAKLGGVSGVRSRNLLLDREMH